MGFTTAVGRTPTFAISKDGDDITRKIADRVISIRVESRDGGGEADVCDITLDDRGWDLSSPSIGDGAATLAVALGYVETGLYPMGTFQVDEYYREWEPKQLRLHGNSLGMNTDAKSPLIASYDGRTLGNILGALASSAGVSAVVSPALSGIVVPYLNQHASSMHLVSELERRFNGLAKWSDGVLSFTERGTGESASGQPLGSFVLGPDDLGTSGNSMKFTNVYGYSHVKASYFDKVAQQLKYVTSAVKGNPNSDVPFLLRKLSPSQAEAQAAADSMMSQLNRKCKEGSITLSKGHAAVRGGQGFAIAGCCSDLDGSYLVRRAVHTLTKDSGLMTSIDCYDEGNGVDFSEQATDTETFGENGIPTTVPLGQGGIGHA